MSDLTPEMLAELRRLLDASTPGPWRDEMMQGKGVTLTAIIAGRPNPDDLRVIGSTLAHNDARVLIAAVNALPALLDAAAERDRLARLLDEPRRSGCAVEIAGVRIAPCDERGQTADMRERDTLADRLAHMTEARDNARAEVERLTAQVERVRALADEWTYKGEFGWDDGSHAYGPDCEGQALDYAAAKLRRALDEEPQS